MKKEKKFNVLAIVGFIFSFTIAFSIVGIVLCIIAIVQINKNKQKQKGMGMAIVGLIISVVLPLFIMLMILIVGVFIFGMGMFMGLGNVTMNEVRGCGEQGEIVAWTDPSTSNECCAGLGDVTSADSISVGDECYSTGTTSGAPIFTCSDCGNGICEDVESVCGCAEDCVGKGKSAYNTTQQFCDEDYDRYCNNITEIYDLDLCDLC